MTREFSEISSNWRATEVADDYLERSGVPVLAEVDTRAVVRHLRTHGVMRGVIASGDALDADALVARARAIRKMEGTDLASVVTTKSIYKWDESEPRNQTGDALLPLPDASTNGKPLHVVAYDFGIKQNILRMLTREGCRVTVVPATTTAEETLALNPDGVFFSNGPGDPEPLGYAIETVRKLKGKKPIFGICLGHQIFGLALGGKTYKLKFGHHGGTTPSCTTRPGRWRSPRRTTTSTSIPRACRRTWSGRTRISTTGRWLACATRPTRCSACSTTRRPTPGRTIRTTCSGKFAG